MYVAEEFGVPVGVVRFDENKDKNVFLISP